MYGSLVLLPIMLQTVLGYPPLQAGIAMAPRGIDRFHDADDGSSHRPPRFEKAADYRIDRGGVTLIGCRN